MYSKCFQILFRFPGAQTDWSKVTQCPNHRTRNSGGKEQTSSRSRETEETNRSNPYLRWITSLQHHRADDQSNFWTVWYYWYGTNDTWFGVGQKQRVLFYSVQRSWQREESHGTDERIWVSWSTNQGEEKITTKKLCSHNLFLQGCSWWGRGWGQRLRTFM